MFISQKMYTLGEEALINIIVAFPKQANAESIKKILQRSGFPVDAVVTTGSQALQYANSLEGGVLICSYRFVDMMYEELYEYLPPNFQMLLVASPAVCNDREIKDLMCLAMPLKVHELVDTLQMISYSLTRKKKKLQSAPKERSEGDKKLLRGAKELLMARNNMTEEEAHRYIQKRSMDNGTALVETAQMILSLMQ